MWWWINTATKSKFIIKRRQKEEKRVSGVSRVSVTGVIRGGVITRSGGVKRNDGVTFRRHYRRFDGVIDVGG